MQITLVWKLDCSGSERDTKRRLCTRQWTDRHRVQNMLAGDPMVCIHNRVTIVVYDCVQQTSILSNGSNEHALQ